MEEIKDIVVGKKRRSISMLQSKLVMKKIRQGRPPKYTSPDEMLPKINEFFKDWDDPKRKDPYLVGGLALALDICDEALKEYATKPDFAALITKAKALCLQDILLKAIRGRINPVFSIFYLKNVFGWADKQEIQNNVKFDIAQELREALKGVKSHDTLDNIKVIQPNAKKQG